MEWNTSELPVSPGKKAKAIEMPFGQVQDSGGPKEPCIRWGPDPPWEGAILRGKANHCEVHGHFAVICAKRLNRSICRLGCGLNWAEGYTSSIVFARWCQFALMGGHIAATWRIRLNNPPAAAMRLLSNYFDHLLSLATPTYTISQIAQRFESNTVFWAIHTIQPSISKHAVSKRTRCNKITHWLKNVFCFFSNNY